MVHPVKPGRFEVPEDGELYAHPPEEAVAAFDAMDPGLRTLCL